MPHRNVANIPLQPVRVLVTGAGGPAAVSVLKSLSADPSVCLIAADMDPWAAGLYLVPPGQRTLIPAGLDPGFVDVVLARCIAMGADVVIPTVDAELRPLGDARTKFAEAGIDLLLAPERALAVTLDKLALARCCASQIPVPRTERFDQVADPQSWTYPVIVKPRTGSGSRGISVVESSQALGRLDASPDFLVQEYLPGEEYSIDVLADAGGRVVAAVPRVRERVDSGVSVAGRTLHDTELERLGAAVATVTGLTYIANVQFRRDPAGRPALLEVNPRVPGTLPLTVASGVDMPRMALDSLRGRPLPARAGFRDVAMVRYLEGCFIELGDVQQVAA
jgi:carbamoyl-phosphate synthase large subunit